MIWPRVAPILLAAFFQAVFLQGCVAAAQPADPGSSAEADLPRPLPDPAAASTSAPANAAMPQPPRDSFTYRGELEQGGWLRGRAPSGTVTARLGDIPLALDENGYFFAAFDRDQGPSARLLATRADGEVISGELAIRPRAWQIEHVNVAARPGGSTEAFMKIRQPELDAIWASRQKETGAQGWRQEFIWPAKGRISGRFGSQRIYRGEPGAYHSGLDISTGASGTPYVAPADGVVVLAVQGYSLEGNLLIIDHGHGLNSAFLHSSRLYVKEGDTVRQGQHIGDIGMSGRATGPHLHWSLKWHEARLDPLLFTGPMG